jgi:hypothetical protein
MPPADATRLIDPTRTFIGRTMDRTADNPPGCSILDRIRVDPVFEDPMFSLVE